MTDFQANETIFASKDLLLLQAVVQSDCKAAKALITAGADPNASKGAPLRDAARKQDYVMMEMLMLSGAQILTALQAAKENVDMSYRQLRDYNERIEGRRYFDDYDYDFDYRRPSAEERQKAEELEKTYQDDTKVKATLEAYETTFFTRVLPLHQARTQMEMLAEIRALRAEMTAHSPLKLKKPHMSHQPQAGRPGGL